MKKLIVLLFISTAYSSYSQKFVNKMTKSTCECASDISTDSKNSTLKLGLCILKASNPYKKEIKKQLGIDLEGEEGYRKLGMFLGTKMAEECPNDILKFSSNITTKQIEDISENSDLLEMDFDKSSNIEQVAEGKVVKIEDGKFVIFNVKNDLGKIEKLYWFTFIKSDLDLVSEYSTLKGKNVSINFSEIEIFDSRINEYRKIKVIEELNIVE